MSSLFTTSAEFFARPQEQKNKLLWGLQGRSSSPGYTAYGGEKLSQSLDQAEIDALRHTNPDMKEAFDVGLERIVDGEKNMWPGEIDGQMVQMKLVIQDFFLKCRQLQVEVMRSIALGMNLKEDFFDEYISEGDNTLRCLHYPPAKKEDFEESKASIRAGAHSDYGIHVSLSLMILLRLLSGSITLLFQDSRGGLQVSSPDGTFVDATPIPGTIVVNAGDLLSRWSNDTIKSTVHRVVKPRATTELLDGETYPARYSVAYFCNPNGDTLIDALPGTWEKEGQKRYEGVTARQWLMKRLTLGHTALPKEMIT